MVGLISTLILLPLAGALCATIVRDRYARIIALGFNLFTPDRRSYFVARFRWHNKAGLQFVERHVWIPAIVPNTSLESTARTSFVSPTSLIIPFSLFAQPSGRGFCALMLVTQSALYGTFTAQNFILWFLFYEMSLIPAFLLIKIWGGENRDYAATKFFLYTFLGSVAMLLSFLGIYFAKGTFDFATLASMGKGGLLTGKVARFAFAGIFLGLAVRSRSFRFTPGCLTPTETAPIGVSMTLTGLLSKMGVYGFVRLLLPLFPKEIQITGPMAVGAGCLFDRLFCISSGVGTIGPETDGRLSVDKSFGLLHAWSLRYWEPGRLVSSPIDMQAALSGVFMQVFNHGITAATLVDFVGLLEAPPRPSRDKRFRWLDATNAPALWLDERGNVFIVRIAGTRMGSIFEFLIFKGPPRWPPWPTAIATLGLLVTAIVFLRAIQITLQRPARSGLLTTSATFCSTRELIVIPVTLLMFTPRHRACSSLSTFLTQPLPRWHDCSPSRHRMSKAIVPVEAISLNGDHL